MTHQELEEYLEGYNLRTALVDNAFRRVWHTLYNANFKKPIRTAEQLHAQWPNYLDRLTKNDDEITLETEEELRNFYIDLKAKFDGNQHGGITDSIIS